MRETRTSGLMSGDGKRSDWQCLKPPRPSSTLPGLVADMGHDDHRQPCITQGGAFGSTTTFVKLDLLAHPVSGAGNILCHGTSIRPALNIPTRRGLTCSFRRSKAQFGGLKR